MPTRAPSAHSTKAVTAVVCCAFDPATDEAILAVRERVREYVRLPDRPPHRPHFTLAAARVPDPSEVVDLAGEIARRHAPVPVRLGEVGRFGRAGVIWLGPGRVRALTALQEDTDATLRAAGHGNPFIERDWVPHCTLATRVPKPLLREIQETVAAGYEPISGTVEALSVILVGGSGDVDLVPLGATSAPLPPSRRWTGRR